MYDSEDNHKYSFANICFSAIRSYWPTVPIRLIPDGSPTDSSILLFIIIIPIIVLLIMVIGIFVFLMWGQSMSPTIYVYHNVFNVFLSYQRSVQRIGPISRCQLKIGVKGSDKGSKGLEIVNRFIQIFFICYFIISDLLFS